MGVGGLFGRLSVSRYTWISVIVNGINRDREDSRGSCLVCDWVTKQGRLSIV